MEYPEISLSEISEIKTRLQAILFSMEEGIVMTDFTGNISIINDSAKKFLGITKKFPYERKFLEYIQDAGVRAKLHALLESPLENLTEEIVVPNGEKEKCLRVTKNGVTTAKAEVLGRVLVLRDVSHERELEKLKEDFVHSITHDLKSPLASIQGYLELFLSGEIEPLSPMQKKHMEIMSHSTGKLLKLVHNILDMAKIEAGHLNLQKGPWDAVHSVHQILYSLQSVSWLLRLNLKGTVRYQKNGAQAEAQIFPLLDSEPLPEIVLLGDANLLERAISNLVDNAIKHTPQNGFIEILLVDEPGRVTLSVKDTGEGIPASALEKIFQKFQQLSGTKCAESSHFGRCGKHAYASNS